jgi:hypothetical protein
MLEKNLVRIESFCLVLVSLYDSTTISVVNFSWLFSVQLLVYYMNSDVQALLEMIIPRKKEVQVSLQKVSEVFLCVVLFFQK